MVSLPSWEDGDLVGDSCSVGLHRLSLRPLALALYLALKEIDRNAMLLATAFMGLFIVLDLAITLSHYASILVLYSSYCIAASDVQRASYLAAANYGAAVLTCPLEVA